jgi:aminoglycoside phosphotransferase (APT) family kinase protein
MSDRTLLSAMNGAPRRSCLRVLDADADLRKAGDVEDRGDVRGRRREDQLPATVKRLVQTDEQADPAAVDERQVREVERDIAVGVKQWRGRRGGGVVGADVELPPQAGSPVPVQLDPEAGLNHRVRDLTEWLRFRTSAPGGVGWDRPSAPYCWDAMPDVTRDPWALGAVRLRDSEVADADVVAALNLATGERYELVRRFASGEFGAWLVRAPGGELCVLKCRFGVDWRERIESVAGIVDALIARGYPAPSVMRWDYDSRVGTWYLVRFLRGQTPSELTPRLVRDLHPIIALQARHGLDRDGRLRAFDWSERVRSMTIEDPTWMDIALSHSAETATLARVVAAALDAHAGTPIPSNDFVHGDLLASQLLVSDGRISGIIDWEQAGIGDRGQDLSLLFLNAHVQASRRGHEPDETVLASLMNGALDASGEGAVAIFLAYEILSMLSFVIARNPRHIAWRLGLGFQVWNSFQRLRVQR